MGDSSPTKEELVSEIINLLKTRGNEHGIFPTSLLPLVLVLSPATKTRGASVTLGVSFDITLRNTSKIGGKHDLKQIVNIANKINEAEFLQDVIETAMKQFSEPIGNKTV